jgi:hypothetical protein
MQTRLRSKFFEEGEGINARLNPKSVWNVHSIRIISEIMHIGDDHSDQLTDRTDRMICSMASGCVLGLGVLRVGPFAEYVDADVGEVEGDSGGEGWVYWEGEAGEIDESGDSSGDEGGVAGVLFERLDEAADAVVVAADFLLEAFFDQGEERAIAEGDGGAGAELEEVF